MRRLIAAAALLSVTTVNAEELKFGDVNYFLKTGQINLAMSASETYDKETLFSSGANPQTRAFVFDPRAGYGITDRLNVYVGLDYAYKRFTRDLKNRSNGRFYSDGFANPVIAGNYRFLSQSEHPVNVDFGAVARVSIGDGKVGSSVGDDKKSGNFNDGRSSLELNARVGHKWNEANEWQAAAGVVYHTTGTTQYRENAGTDVVDSDSSFDTFLRGTYQYRPVNEFMILLSAQATNVGEISGEDQGNGKWNADSHLDFVGTFQTKYLITENFIAKFTLSQSHLSNYDVKLSDTDDEIKKRRQASWGLGVDFLF